MSDESRTAQPFVRIWEAISDAKHRVDALESAENHQYAILLGRSGGQSLAGGRNDNETLWLYGNHPGTTGTIVMQPSGGNVGIGTIPNPSYALDVNGTIHSTALSVDDTVSLNNLNVINLFASGSADIAGTLEAGWLTVVNDATVGGAIVAASGSVSGNLQAAGSVIAASGAISGALSVNSLTVTTSINTATLIASSAIQSVDGTVTGSLYALGTIFGGDSSGDDLILESTPHATKGYVIIQPDGGRIGINANDPEVDVEVVNSVANERGIMSSSHANSPGRSGFVTMRRSRNTRDSPGTVQDGDRLGSLASEGYDGNSYQRGARIDFIVNGSVSDGTVPTDVIFQSGGSFGTDQTNLTVRNTGAVIVRDQLSIGTGEDPDTLVFFHDGTTGFAIFTVEDVGATAVTLIANGSTDVISRLKFEATTVHSGGGVNFRENTITPGGGSQTLYVNGLDTCSIFANADGSVQVQRGSGSGTYDISIRVFWR